MVYIQPETTMLNWLVDEAGMPYNIVFETATTAQDTAGSPVRTWTALDAVSGTIIPVSAKTRELHRRLGQAITHVVFVIDASMVDQDTRMTVNSRQYKIVNVIRPKWRFQPWKIECEVVS